MPIELGYSPKQRSGIRRQMAAEVSRLLLWGLCGALAVAAVEMIRKAPDARATAQRERAAETGAENRAFCEKWGMPFGTAAHVTCTRDLDEIRARHDKRLADDAGGLL